MAPTLAARARAQALFDAFQQMGAQPVETAILLPAETLLDLYGETIRNRAYVTHDPVQGEMMLRPDFTVPMVQMHMQDGAEPARYTYMGDVFRKQTADTGKPSEFLQVGYEVFDRTDPAASDAEVFAAFAGQLSGVAVEATIGDIGLLKAAVAGLETSQARKSALLRHIWRPARFDTLLERFSGPRPPRLWPETDAPHIGLRSRAEILARQARLDEDSAQSPLPARQLAALSDLLSLNATASDALPALQTIAGDLPFLAPAIDLYERRLNALSAVTDISELRFEGSYGRTSLEYYDGFVFGFSAAGADTPVASGGRYDALTHVLGQGREIPAVGGILRPELLMSLEDAQ